MTMSLMVMRYDPGASFGGDLAFNCASNVIIASISMSIET